MDRAEREAYRAEQDFNEANEQLHRLYGQQTDNHEQLHAAEGAAGRPFCRYSPPEATGGITNAAVAPGNMPLSPDGIHVSEIRQSRLARLQNEQREISAAIASFMTAQEARLQQPQQPAPVQFQKSRLQREQDLRLQLKQRALSEKEQALRLQLRQRRSTQQQLPQQEPQYYQHPAQYDEEGREVVVFPPLPRQPPLPPGSPPRQQDFQPPAPPSPFQPPLPTGPPPMSPVELRGGEMQQQVEGGDRGGGGEMEGVVEEEEEEEEQEEEGWNF